MSPTKYEIDFGYFERKREPADIAIALSSFSKCEDASCMKERKSKGRGHLYTHTQAPNARTLQDSP